MIKVRLYSEDSALQVLLSSALGKEFHVFMVSNVDEISRKLSAEDCDVALLDLNADHHSVQERIECARRVVGSQPRWVIMADDPLRLIALELVRLGAFGYCRRPPSIRDLRVMLRRACDQSTLERQLHTAQQQLEIATGCDRMIGSSPKMQKIYQLIHSVTDINVSVLITGQSGTGKELVARAIHFASQRRYHPLVAIHCGALTETLLESELFGHEKGAFTGAIARKIGRLELAHEGTLFLDEVGELPLDLQPKLLRALQEREIERLGGTRPIPINVRLIAATNRDLAKMVAEREFRSDLFYRLKVFPVFAPPLRDRVADIPILVRHFVSRHARRMGKTIETIPPEAMDALVAWKWPGNIRELENFLERAVILTRGPVLYVPLAEIEAMQEEEEDDTAFVNPTLQAAELETILRALRDAKGVIGGPGGAAERLGLKRTTLNSKIKKLGIERGDYI